MAILQNLEQTVTLLIILSILVVAHEWGHFIVARLCGIRVDDFSIGFGKRLFRIAKRGDTEYNVRILPLGGFVKIAGMEPDEAPITAVKDKLTAKSDPDAADIPLLAENTAEDRSYTAPDGFYSKPLWQRSLVILAGPVMSFVLGYVVFCLMGLTTGVPTGKTLPKVGMTAPGGEGQRIGLQIGDTITAIDGKPVADGDQMVDMIHGSANKRLVLTVQRGSKTLTLPATPRPAKDDQNKPIQQVDVTQPGALDALGVQVGDSIAQIGDTQVDSAAQVQTLLQKNVGKTTPLIVFRDHAQVDLKGSIPAAIAQTPPTLNGHTIGLLQISPAKEIKRLGFVDSIHYGNSKIYETFYGLGYLIHHRELHKAAGGIIFMYQATGLAVKSGLPEIASMLASLSLSLAIFNLLPIPVLDGGHLLTFFIEWVRRGKRLTDQQQQASLMFGLAIIGVLFVLIVSNDIIRTVTHQLPQ